MLKNNKWLVLVVLVMAAVAITACAAPEPEQVVVTVEVQGEGGETMIVTATPSAETAAEGGIPEGPLAADGQVACNPLPEMAYGTGAGVAAPAAPASAPVSFVPENLASPAAQGGQVYRVGTFEDVTTLNFWAANGPDNTVYNSYMLPPRLTMYGLDARTYQFAPSAAADMPGELTEEDGMWTVTVPIRDDIFWSDGEPFTAADWAFTAQATLDLGLISGNWNTWYPGDFLDHIEVVDDYTAKVWYSQKPGLAVNEYGVLQSYVLAEHYWAPYVEEAMAPITALGDSPSEEDLAAAQAEAADILFAVVPDGEPTAGAYTLDSREPGAFVEESAYDQYFNAGTTIRQYSDGTYQELDASGNPTMTLYGEGTGDVDVEFTVGPNVDSVVYTIYGSQDAALLALRAGEIDYMLNSLGLQQGLAEQAQSDPNVTVVQNPTNGFRYLSFNNRRRPMNDCAFRQAMAVLIDKEFVTQTILQGVAFPLYSFVPEGNAAWYYDDVPKIGQGLDREQRVNTAIAILEQAGYSWTDDQKPTWDADNRQVVAAGRLIMPDGTPLPDLNLYAPSAGYDPLRSTFAIWIESWSREFGIPVTANLAGFNVLVPIIFTEQDFDMYILGWSLSIFPDYLYDFFAIDQAAQDGNNAGGYANPDFEEVASQLKSCDTLESCKALSDQTQEILAEEVPYVVLFATPILDAYRSASIEFPYTDVLNGLVGASQNGYMAEVVRVK